ncbi:MAG: hypothetical protein JNK85_03265 [Verrucomicrobiales bacterium]|nr:hypothetical protein [Verrucomicrobiales bacterium]
MPELPDITVYLEAIESRTAGQRLVSLRVRSPFLLRTFKPTPEEMAGRRLVGLRRLGKRLAFGFEGDFWAVLHLMIAGRLHWFAKAQDRAKPSAQSLAVLEFENGWLSLTEAGTKRRASLHLVAGEAGLGEHQPGGLEVLECSEEAFEQAIRSERHTLKRALTDPHLFSGIGNAYSDEILHAAKLSPVAMTTSLKPEQVSTLFRSTGEVLRLWIERLRQEAGQGFPEKVTAFRPEMAVHGKFRQPCPACGTPIQRIVHSANETNYCPKCQTGGKLLADRALSPLLRKDWPATVEAWEAMRAKR